jgi:hypothetical protein
MVSLPTWFRQRANFARASRHFVATYAGLQQHELKAFTTPYWARTNDAVAARLLPVPPVKFLRDPFIAGNMVVNSPEAYLREELAFLEARLRKQELRHVLREEYVGGAPRVDVGYRTSHNTIHHAYHLERFREATGIAPGEFGTVVEWGGGYGNLARLVTRSATVDQTYVVVDNPLFSALQWLYLTSVFGEEKVSLLSAGGDGIVAGALNLVPTGLLETIDDLHADLFISTWALSESAPAALEHVLERDWFRAPHLLLAYRDSDSSEFPTQTHMRAHAERRGATPAAIDFLPGESYAFS